MKNEAAAVFESESSIYKTDGFRMFCFKVLPCSKRYCHDWTTCPFAHPGEKARRRDPRALNYTGVACPDTKQNVQCPRGDACPYAHNVFEYWLHPSRYRTQLCNDGIQCARKICFFAHTLDELRVPDTRNLPAELLKEFQEDSTLNLTFDGDSPKSILSKAIPAGLLSPVSPSSPISALSLDSAVLNAEQLLKANHILSSGTQSIPQIQSPAKEPLSRTASGSIASALQAQLAMQQIAMLAWRQQQQEAEQYLATFQQQLQANQLLQMAYQESLNSIQHGSMTNPFLRRAASSNPAMEQALQHLQMKAILESLPNASSLLNAPDQLLQSRVPLSAGSPFPAALGQKQFNMNMLAASGMFPFQAKFPGGNDRGADLSTVTAPTSDMTDDSSASEMMVADIFAS